MIEEFKIIPGFEPYEVSNMGRLRRDGKILSTPIGTTGYPRKRFKQLKKNLVIHRAVALCFIPNPDNKCEVNHKDLNKANNNVSNLEWVTRKENMAHAFESGVLPDNNGEKSVRAKLKNHDIIIIREAYANGFSQKQIASYLRCNKCNISRIVNGLRWSSVQ